MTENADLKNEVYRTIDERSEEIIAISEDLMRHPETGFREFRSADQVMAAFDGLGIKYESGLARTGVKGRLFGRAHNATVAILGELDSLLIPDHPLADPKTGAAHACGHHAQIAAMVGAAMGLQTVIDHLDGDVVLFAVPAEECIEIDWRLKLREQGEIEFLVGKAELIRQGHFDDVDIAMLTHTPSAADSTLASVGDSHNGAVLKLQRFLGRGAHAGAYPHKGINALKAAELSMLAVDAQRETFQDDDNVRVHYVIPMGGQSLNVVPAEALVELQVRARNLDALYSADRTVDRSVDGVSAAFGATCESVTVCGYLPHIQDPMLTEMMRENCSAVVGRERVGAGKHVAGSTDMGDLSAIMPVSHPRSGGTEGSGHSNDFRVVDQNAAAVNPAKWMAGLAVDLLVNGCQSAVQVKQSNAGRMSKEAYLTARRGLERRAVLGSGSR